MAMRRGRKFRDYTSDVIATWRNARQDRLRLRRSGVVEWQQHGSTIWGRLADWPTFIAAVHESAEMQAYFREQHWQ